MGGDQRGHARGRGAAEAGPQRDAFLHFQLEAVCQPQSLARGQHRLAGGVAFGRERKRRDTFDLATDRGDTHQRLGDVSHDRDVAWSGDRVAEQVEADADIADAGRRECAGLAAMLTEAHARAPSALAIASTSPKTPAAVPSGPAPGPCTPSGLPA